MKKFSVIIAVVLITLMLPAAVFGKGTSDDKAQTAAPAQTSVPIKGKIILSTTTSTQDSGLLDYLLPVFTKETGWEVDTIAVGTGEALRMGRSAEADVLLVHAKADEIKFVNDGYGVKRYDVMYNDFVVVGPKEPIAYNDDVNKTFKDIAAQSLPFVSRGDDSGTHKMENTLWKNAGVDVKANKNYASAGQGMGATLQMANQLNAYTLSDRATWLTQKNSSLAIVCEKSQDLLNYYGVIAVTPKPDNKVNAEGGKAFVDWMIKDSTQKVIGEYGVKEYGGSLFTPNAQANK